MSSSTSSQVRTPSVPWTPTQGRHPTLIHPGPPEMSIRLMILARPQRSTKASQTAPHHPSSPPCNRHRLERAWGGVYVLSEKNKPTQPSYRVLLGVLAFSFHNHL